MIKATLNKRKGTFWEFKIIKKETNCDERENAMRKCVCVCVLSVFVLYN